MVIIQFFKKWLTQPVKSQKSPQAILWLSCSLGITIFYGLNAIIPTLTNDYIIQDDARQHVIWTLRFWDAELFPNDIIIDYFQSSAPLGYKYLYKFAATIGIHPFILSNLFPLVLGIISTIYAFAVSQQILPVPLAGFFSTVFLNQLMWGEPLLVGVTPRAFYYPLFFVFLYYLLRGSLLLTLVGLALQGLFYPPSVLVSGGILILRLLDWHKGIPQLKFNRNHLILSLSGLGVIFLVLLPEVLIPKQFGSIISVSEAKQMPEFLPGGRSGFFDTKFWDFWFSNQHSGFGFWEHFNPPVFYLALLVPIILSYPNIFPLIKQITTNIVIFVQGIISSIGLFFLAHALLFHLYLPSRYGIGVTLAIRFLTGIALVIVLDAVLNICEQSKKLSIKVLAGFFLFYIVVISYYWYNYFYPVEKKLLIILLSLGILCFLITLYLEVISYQSKSFSKLAHQILATSLSATIMGIVLSYPSWIKGFPSTDYFIGTAPKLYQFLAQQPKDILIASMSLETDNLPSFAQRSILVSREYSLPYHLKYYHQMRQRVIDLINAQYSPNLEDVKSFIQKYGVDFWLVENNVFTSDYFNNPDTWETRLSSAWLKEYQPATNQALARLKQGIKPALAIVINSCSVLNEEQFILIDTNCILSQTITNNYRDRDTEDVFLSK